MAEHWLATTDTREAAAFATLGVHVQIRSDIIERTGTKTVRFLMSAISRDGSLRTGSIREAFKSGELAKLRPVHPYVVLMCALLNRESIIAHQKTGDPVRLENIDGTGVHRFFRGDTGLPGLSAAVPVIRTSDLNLVAALCTAGLPLVHLEGDPGRLVYYVAARNPAFPDLDGAVLTADWRNDPAAAPFEGPFHIAAHGLAVASTLRDMVRKEVSTVILSKPGTTSHVLIRADAAPAAWDHAARFLS